MVEGISLDVIFYFQKEILILKYANSKGIPSKPKTLFWRQFNVFRMLYGRLIDVEITLKNLLNFKTCFDVNSTSFNVMDVRWTLKEYHTLAECEHSFNVKSWISEGLRD